MRNGQRALMIANPRRDRNECNDKSIKTGGQIANRLREDLPEDSRFASQANFRGRLPFQSLPERS